MEIKTTGAINDVHGGEARKGGLCFWYFIYIMFNSLFVSCFICLCVRGQWLILLDANVDIFACGAVPELWLPHAAIKAQ
jgi:hypothetical protein